MALNNKTISIVISIYTEGYVIILGLGIETRTLSDMQVYYNCIIAEDWAP